MKSPLSRPPSAAYDEVEGYEVITGPSRPLDSTPPASSENPSPRLEFGTPGRFATHIQLSNSNVNPVSRDGYLSSMAALDNTLVGTPTAPPTSAGLAPALSDSSTSFENPKANQPPAMSYTRSSTELTAYSPSYQRPAQTVTSFGFFRLPLELRCMIWNYLIDADALITVKNIKVPTERNSRLIDPLERRLTHFIPTALHICFESRELSLEKLEAWTYEKRHYGSGDCVLYTQQQSMWWNPHSILLFESFPQRFTFKVIKDSWMDWNCHFDKFKVTSLAFKVLVEETTSEDSGTGTSIRTAATNPLFNVSVWVAQQLVQYQSLQRLVFVKSTVASIGRGYLHRGTSRLVTLYPEGSKEGFGKILKAEMGMGGRFGWWKDPKIEIVTEEEFMRNG